MKLILSALLAAPLLLAIAVAAQPPHTPRIVGLSHIAVRAHDMAASRHFYTDLLGFEEAFSVGGSHVSLKVNDRQYIVLVPESKPEEQRFVDYGLETDDAEGMRLYLKSHG